ASFGFGEERLIDAETAQPLRAGAFEILEVIRVIHDATRVGVLIIYANLQRFRVVAAVRRHGFVRICNRRGGGGESRFSVKGRQLCGARHHSASRRFITLSAADSTLIFCASASRRPCTSTTPSLSPRSPTVIRTGTPISSQSANMTPGRVS